MNATLVGVFNHRFDANLPVLRDMYAGRFTHHRFLVPGYDGADRDVIAVWGHWHRFPIFYAQAIDELLALDSDAYVFCHDDLALAPSLSEDTLEQRLGIGDKDAYIKMLRPLESQGAPWALGNGGWLWPRRKSAGAWRQHAVGPELATVMIAHQADVGVGATLRPADIARVLRHNGSVRHAWQEVYGYRFLLRALLHPSVGLRSEYPMAAGYSDFIVVRRKVLASFARWCGLLAGDDLFAEVSAPTALVLSGATIGTEQRADGEGIEFWDAAEVEAFGESMDWSLPKLLADFPDDALWVHPVKLSRWEL